MSKRVPGPPRRGQSLSDLVENRLSSADWRAELVRLPLRPGGLRRGLNYIPEVSTCHDLLCLHTPSNTPQFTVYRNL